MEKESETALIRHPNSDTTIEGEFWDTSSLPSLGSEHHRWKGFDIDAEVGEVLDGVELKN